MNSSQYGTTVEEAESYSEIQCEGFMMTLNLGLPSKCELTHAGWYWESGWLRWRGGSGATVHQALPR